MASAQRLKGRVAVVTGGTKGIGQGVVLRFLEAIITGAEGAISRGIATRFEIEGATVSAIAPGEGVDLATEFDAILEKAGGLDILANAGQAKTIPASLATKPLGDFESSFCVGPLAALQAMKAAYPDMLKRGGGRVLND